MSSAIWDAIDGADGKTTNGQPEVEKSDEKPCVDKKREKPESDVLPGEPPAKKQKTEATTTNDFAGAFDIPDPDAVEEQQTEESNLFDMPDPDAVEEKPLEDDKDPMASELCIKQGAEARIYKARWQGKTTVIKHRFSKKYRHPDLDQKLTRSRTKREVKWMGKAKALGLRTPEIYKSDYREGTIFMEHVDLKTCRDTINGYFSKRNGKYNHMAMKVCESMGRDIAKLHDANIIHGDLTTSNCLVDASSATVANKFQMAITWIDFGLGAQGLQAEDKAVDLYVLERAFISTHPHSELLVKKVLATYQKESKDGAATIKRLDAVRMRGRKKTCFG